MSGMTAVVQNLVKMNFEDIPIQTIERQKDLLLDTLGVAVAGSGAPGVAQLVEFLHDIGGKAEASIMVFGGKCPSFHAAMANSLMAHSMDFDDMHETAGIHANVCVVPAALALAERNKNISGRMLLTAVVLGVDLACRMGAAIPLHRGWHATATFGVFGAAAAAAKILGLDEARTANALGIAYSQASGNRQARVEKTLTKRLQPALATKAGVIAALLAGKGMTGPRDILSGEWGMLRLYAGSSRPENEQPIINRLTNGLGEIFYGDRLSIKPYPCCKAAHTAIAGALQLRDRMLPDVDRIETVEVFVSKGCYQTVGRPFEMKENPQVEAQFSIPYTVATALLEGRLGLEDFTEPRIRDHRRIDLAKRVLVRIDPGLEEPSSNVVNLTCRLAIHTEGKTHTCDSLVVKGHPDYPMERNDIVAKLDDCLQFGKPVYLDKKEEILANILNLEKETDIGNLMALFRRT